MVQGRAKPPRAKHHCSNMEKPHARLDECPRILLSSFRARISASLSAGGRPAWHRRNHNMSHAMKGGRSEGKGKGGRRSAAQSGGAIRPLSSNRVSCLPVGIKEHKSQLQENDEALAL